MILIGQFTNYFYYLSLEKKLETPYQKPLLLLLISVCWSAKYVGYGNVTKII